MILVFLALLELRLCEELEWCRDGFPCCKLGGLSKVNCLSCPQRNRFLNFEVLEVGAHAASPVAQKKEPLQPTD